MRNTSRLFTGSLLVLFFSVSDGFGADAKEPAKRWSGDGISWEVPKGWKQEEANAPMRFATLTLPAEPKPLQLAVTRFPGDVGGTLANVNRWRAQIKLPPIKEEDVGKHATNVEISGVKALLVDASNPETKERLLGVILPDANAGQTWFFKVMGPTDAIAPHKPDLDAFLKTVRLGGGGK